MLTNLVKNAIKYSDSGEIEFGYSKKGDVIEFLVRDTGIGVPAERQQAIFERFVQADVADTMARQGVGLGLAISKAYVEMMGGRIWIESNEGEGSSFYFTLPLMNKGEEKKSHRETAYSGDTELDVRKLNILIADDDDTYKRLLQIELGKYSKQLYFACDGTEVIALCRNHKDIDLILMDIKMPLMNGYEATRLVRQFNKEVVIVAQTAYGLSGDREKAIGAGCNDYLSKPLKMAELRYLLYKYFG